VNGCVVDGWNIFYAMHVYAHGPISIYTCPKLVELYVEIARRSCPWRCSRNRYFNSF